MHDGRLMRYHKPGSTLDMLLHEAVPRRSDGALALCQDCQRRMWFAGGYLEWLANRLENLGRSVARLQQYFLPKLRALQVGQECTAVTRDRERAVDMAKDVADENGWALLIRRRGSDLVTIARTPAPSAPMGEE